MRYYTFLLLKLAIMKGLFISGSSTDVGKTFIAEKLIRLLKKSRLVAVRKPVESDCTLINGKLTTKDASKLLALSNIDTNIDTVCAYKFHSCCSAERASQAENVDLSLQQLIDACQSDEFTIVEGAGGLLSPIANNTLNIDLIKSLKFPLIIVVKDGVGAVNQALMSILAAKKYNLKISCVILNQFKTNTLDNADVISHYAKCEVVIYNRNSVDEFNQRMGEILDLPIV
jgi:dethiobiotin synthetase